MRFAVTNSADRTPSLPASLSAFICGCLWYGHSAATLITPSASHPPLLPPGRRGDTMGCLSTAGDRHVIPATWGVPYGRSWAYRVRGGACKTVTLKIIHAAVAGTGSRCTRYPNRSSPEASRSTV